MIKHIISFLCIAAALSVSGIIFADFGFADCIASSFIVLAVYAAAYRVKHRKNSGCTACSGCCTGCAHSGECKNTENQQP